MIYATGLGSVPSPVRRFHGELPGNRGELR